MHFFTLGSGTKLHYIPSRKIMGFGNVIRTPSTELLMLSSEPYLKGGQGGQSPPPPLKLPQRNIYIMMYITIINNLQYYIMTEERLSGLALLYIHRDTHFIPSPEDIYSKKANWRHVREN